MTEVQSNISNSSQSLLLQSNQADLIKDSCLENKLKQDSTTQTSLQNTATLIASYPMQAGLMAEIINFISINNGNIINAIQHMDSANELCFTRIEWGLDKLKIPHHLIKSLIALLTQHSQADWQLHFKNVMPRVAIWVSRQDHCLLDLIWIKQAKELTFELPIIISNHLDLKRIAEQFNIEYHYIPITKENKIEQETRQLELMQQHKIDLVVLAKYMQVLSPNLINKFPKAINIHNSLLPAFVGAKPYHGAYERGVKIIGATAHYVTADLDAGPIIEQDVIKVTHLDKVNDLIRKGKDVEKLVLSRAVRLHLHNRVMVNGNSTVVFS